MDLEQMASCSEDGDVLDINIDHESDDETLEGSWETPSPAIEEPKELVAPLKPRAPPGAGNARAMRGRGNPNHVLRRLSGHGFRGTGRDASPGWRIGPVQQAPTTMEVSAQPSLSQKSPWLPGHAPGMQPACPGPLGTGMLGTALLGAGRLGVLPSIPLGIGNLQTSNIDPFLAETDVGLLQEALVMPEEASKLDYHTQRRLLKSLLSAMGNKRQMENAQILGSADPTQWQGGNPLPHPLGQDLHLPDGQNLWNRSGSSLTNWKPPSLGLHTPNPEEVNKQHMLKRGLATVAPMQRSGCRPIILPGNNVPSSVQFQQTPSRANSAGWARTPFNRTYRSPAGTNFNERRNFGLQRSRVLRSKPLRYKNQLNRPFPQSETVGKSEQNADSAQCLETNLSEHVNPVSDQSECQDVDASKSESLADTLLEPKVESAQLKVTAESLPVSVPTLIETQHSAPTLPEPQISVPTLSVPQKAALPTVPQHSVTAVPEAKTVSEQREPPQTELPVPVASVSAEILVPQPAVPPKTETQLSVPISQTDETSTSMQHPAPGLSLGHSPTRQLEVVPSAPCQNADRGRSESQQPCRGCSGCQPLKVERPMARCEHPLHDSKCPDCICSDPGRSKSKKEKFHRSLSPFSLQQSRSRRSGSSSSDCSAQCYRLEIQEEQERSLRRREQELIRIESERRNELRRLQALRWQEFQESARRKRYHGRSRSPESYGRHRSDRYSPESRRYESNGYRPRDYGYRHHYERGHSDNNPYNFRHRVEHYHREPKHYRSHRFGPTHYRPEVDRMDFHSPSRLHTNSYHQTVRSTDRHSGNTIEPECPRMDLQRQPTHVEDLGVASSGQGGVRERHGTCSTEPSADSPRMAVNRECPSSAPKTGVEQQNFAAILEKLEAEMERVKQAILQKKQDPQMPQHP